MKSIIDEISSKYLSKVKTTKDLIYKHKLIKPNGIDKQYKEMDSFTDIRMKYGKHSLYFNDTINSLFEMSSMFFHLNTSEFIEEYDPIKTLTSFFTSEIQNSLWIEGIRSSKKKIKQVIKDANSKLEVKEEKITANFNQALHFIFNTNEISEQNLFALYTILTKDIDMGEEKLDGYPYRKGYVEIGSEKYNGISPELIKESMDSIFSFIKDEVKEVNWDADDFNEDLFVNFLHAIVIHYLFEIIHPYYDYNGRTGRLLSLWFCKNTNILPFFARYSQAINLYKENYYYKAFAKTVEKNFKFDATYFVGSSLSMLMALTVSLTILMDINKEVKNKHASKLSELESDILVSLLNKNFDEFYKGQELILGYDEITPSLITKAFANLEKYNLIQAINSKPKEYKLLLSDKHKKKIKELIN